MHATRLANSSLYRVQSAACTRSVVPNQFQFQQRARSVARIPRSRVVAFAEVEKVNAEQLEVIIQERQAPLIVDFFATWCGPCVMLSKELEQVASDLGDRVRVVKVDVDENPSLSSQLQIQGLPTMVFIGTDPSKPALRTEGYLPADTIKQILKDDFTAEAAS